MLFASEDVELCPFYGSTVEECNLFTRSFCSIRFWEITSFPKICNEITHHSMLPLIISCTRSWNFAWHLLWCSTTESKNIVKLLAISQTCHTVCCEDDYFPKEKFKFFLNSLFPSVYLVFKKGLFSIAYLFVVRYLWVECNEDKCCVVTQRAADIHVAWLVYLACLSSHVLRTYCNFESKQANSFTLFGRHPNNNKTCKQNRFHGWCDMEERILEFRAASSGRCLTINRFSGCLKPGAICPVFS